MESNGTELERWLSRARVLIIDDEPANLTYLRHVLETEGYGELIAMPDAATAFESIREIEPDLIMVDLWMPRMDGFEFLSRVHDVLPATTYLPVLVVTGDPTPESRRRALSLGARDFLTKPLSPSEVRLRVRNLMETRFLHEQLKHHNTELEQRVDERTIELEEARLEILYRLARAAEFRDDVTGQHTLRVGQISGRIAVMLGMSEQEAQLIARAAPLHDIGKIGIPDAVLLKPGRLDVQERRVIEAHTTIGAEILSGSRSPLLQLAEEIALTHHERWDGLGYPRGIGEHTIPISGRITAVADVFDALTHSRPYKPAWTIREALAEIEGNAGTQFDTAVVDALFRIAPEVGFLEIEAARAAARRAPPPVLTFAGPSMGADPEVQRLRTERDELAREVEDLRLQLSRTAAVRRQVPRTTRRRSRAS